MQKQNYKAKGCVYFDRDRYVAEINFFGYRIRRSSVNKAIVEEWKQDVVTTLNELLSEYENDLSLSLREAREKAYEDFQNKLKPTLDAARAYDTRCEIGARAKGIIRTSHFQTYLVLDEETKLIKTGKSHDVYTRVNQLGRKGRLLLARCDKDVEGDIKEQYRKKRFAGEWFKFTKDDIDEIINLYNFIDYRNQE